MTISFENEVRLYLRQRREQNPTLHALTTGQVTFSDLTLQETLETFADLASAHTVLITRAAKEIDKLRAATDTG